MMQLRFATGSQPEVPLEGQRITLGRESSNDVVLDDPEVSGVHAEIVASEGKFFVRDRGSTNGTRLNGEFVDEAQPLSSGDVLVIGSTELRVEGESVLGATRVQKAVESASESAEVEPWQLEGKSEGLPTTFAIHQDIAVGRSPEADLTIEKAHLSHQHARLWVDQGRLRVRDLDSTNGTFVNGQSITDSFLQDGDEVRFDQFAFRVRAPESARKSSSTVARPAVDPSATQQRPAAPEGGTQQIPSQSGATLTELGAEGEPRQLPIPAAGGEVGRSSACEMSVDDPTVSSRHARLRPAGNVWEIEDLGSTNGLFVDGKQVQKSSVSPGSEIRLGKVRFRLEAKGGYETQVFASVGSETATDDSASAGSSSRPASHSRFAAFMTRTPVWAYGVAGFLVVALLFVGVLFWNGVGFGDSSIQAPLQAGQTWARQLPAGRENPKTPALADINGDAFLDVVIADVQGHVLALDGQEGKRIFDVDVVDRVLAPPVVGDLNRDKEAEVVVASNTGVVTALNGQGKVLWQSDPEIGMGSIYNRPVLEDVNDDGQIDVVVPTQNLGLVALDGNRGYKLWDTAESTAGNVVTSPLVADVNGDGNTDFVSVTDSGQVAAYSTDGERILRLWSNEDVPSVRYASPAFLSQDGGGHIVIATKSNGLIALDGEEGRLAWRVKTQDTFFASPTVVSANGDDVPDIAAVSEGGQVLVVNGETGEEIWSKQFPGDFRASPVPYDFNDDGLQDLALIDRSGLLRIVDMSRGTTLVEKPLTDDGFVASPVLGDVTRDGMMEIVAASEQGKIVTATFNRRLEEGTAVWSLFLGDRGQGGGR